VRDLLRDSDVQVGRRRVVCLHRRSSSSGRRCSRSSSLIVSGGSGSGRVSGGRGRGRVVLVHVNAVTADHETVEFQHEHFGVFDSRDEIDARVQVSAGRVDVEHFHAHVHRG